MIFESKRLLELAGISDGDENNLLNESVEEEIVAENMSTEEEIRETVREELASLWASGQVFGTKKEENGGVTLGFAGIGFKK